MYLESKMPENGRNNVFTDKQNTKNVPLIFFYTLKR